MYLPSPITVLYHVRLVNHTPARPTAAQAIYPGGTPSDSLTIETVLSCGAMRPPRRRWTPRTLWTWRYVREERRRVNRLAFLLFWSLLLYGIIQHAVVGVGIVTDVSMRPTLREGDYFLINKYLYRVTPPRRGDLVVLKPHEGESDRYVKRLIGLPGELLQIADGAVYINGQQLREPYAAGKTYPALGPIRLGDHAYFVLGDNRLASEDSREFGSVPRDALEGKLDPHQWFPLR